LRLRGLLPESCFADAQEAHLAMRKPGEFGNDTVMRRQVTAYEKTGQLPFRVDKYGNAIADIEGNVGFKGRTAHPDAALAQEGANAATCAVPPNAITPGLSNQQAAYVQSRPQVSESFYGHSVYRSAHRSLAPSGDDTRSMSRSMAMSGRSSRGRLSRSPSRFLGDRSSIRSGAKTPRSGRSSERGSKRGSRSEWTSKSGIGDMTLKTLSLDQASIRGPRHGEIEGVDFTDSDHVIAYKLVNRIEEGKQLTLEQVQEAVVGQFAALAVKKKVEHLVSKQDGEAKLRKGIFYRKIGRKGLFPSRELLNDVTREMVGLEECKNFRKMMDECRLNNEREVLCFPIAYPVRQRQPEPEPEPSEHGDSQQDPAVAISSRHSGSRSSMASVKTDLRHPVLGETFLEARVPNGNLLHDSYLIQARDTKQVLLNVQQTSQGIVFVDQDMGEVASFAVLQDGMWRCATFGESEVSR